jgi:hypothetical protein
MLLGFMGDFQNTGYHLDRDWIAREEYGIDHDTLISSHLI